MYFNTQLVEIFSHTAMYKIYENNNKKTANNYMTGKQWASDQRKRESRRERKGIEEGEILLHKRQRERERGVGSNHIRKLK